MNISPYSYSSPHDPFKKNHMNILRFIHLVCFEMIITDGIRVHHSYRLDIVMVNMLVEYVANTIVKTMENMTVYFVANIIVNMAVNDT